MGGERGTSTTDFTGAASLWLEKGHDSWPDDYSVGQADIEKFYDNIEPVNFKASPMRRPLFVGSQSLAEVCGEV